MAYAVAPSVYILIFPINDMSHKVRKVFRKDIILKSGDTLSIVFDPKEEHLLIDKVRKDEMGGNEIFNKNVGRFRLPSLKEINRAKLKDDYSD